jgi:hypothetical protein
LALQNVDHRQRVAQAPRQSPNGSDPQRCKVAFQRRGEVAKLLDAGDRADGGAFVGVEQLRPQLNRQITLPARGSSDHVKHHLGHHVEGQHRAGQPLCDSRDQPVDLIALSSVSGTPDSSTAIEPTNLIVMPLRTALAHAVDRPARTRFRVRTCHSARLAAVSLRADKR